MNKLVFSTLLIFSLFLTACATTPQAAVELDSEDWRNPANKIALVVADIPAPTMETPGASCLLCIAAARAANSSLIDHTESLSSDDLAGLSGILRQAIEQSGVGVEIVPWDNVDKLPKFKGGEETSAKKDFKSLGELYKVSHVLVVNVSQVGMNRNYSSYFPTGDPSASARGEAYLVDVNTNAYKWYLPLTLDIPAEGSWDEPPSFPGLTNAFYQILAITQEKIISPFSREPQASAY